MKRFIWPSVFLFPLSIYHQLSVTQFRRLVYTHINNICTFSRTGMFTICICCTCLKNLGDQSKPRFISRHFYQPSPRPAALWRSPRDSGLTQTDLSTSLAGSRLTNDCLCLWAHLSTTTYVLACRDLCPGSVPVGFRRLNHADCGRVENIQA